MNYPVSSGFKIVSGMALVTPIALSATVDMPVYVFGQENYASTKQREDYSPYTQSTLQNITIFPNKQAVMEFEKTNIIDEIEKKLHTNIESAWVPNDSLNEKTCLFVKCEAQNHFASFEEYDQFEAKLYESLKETLARSQHFNMVALM